MYDWYVLDVEVADSRELYEGAEDEEEAACEVDVDGLHVADLGHAVVAASDYGQQSEHCRDSCKSIHSHFELLFEPYSLKH